MSSRGVLYFAFGSNLDGEQMQRRCPSAVAVGRAVLPGHALAFAGESRTWDGGGVATVVPAVGARVEGLLYRVSLDDLAVLDRCEGHPIAYRRVRCLVEREGRRLRAHTYVKPLDGLVLRAPARAYAMTLRRAYKAHGFDLGALRATLGSYAPAPVAEPAEAARTAVFVYGTLLAGERNHRLLQAHGGRLVGAAQTVGRFQLYDLGSFPGLVPGGGSTPVVGEVYEVDAVGLAALDRLEGHPNLYQRARIRLDGGRVADAYFLRPDQVAGYNVITSGSWRARQGAVR